jgi:hypothetical protein
MAALLLATPLMAEEKTKAAATGMICVAPFHVQPVSREHPPASEPLMSTTTWAPSADSKFVFRVGKTIKATVANHQMVAIHDVPADRKVLVGIRLDGKPFESFYVDLRKEKNRRICLWLYKGYWHWINTGWEEVQGCRCG